jgi:5'(3')-deoxyribonucleotidase
MKKLKIFIDFDEVIADTSQAICDYYNNNYYHREGFQEAIIENMMEYDFTDACPLMTRAERMFMFDNPKFFGYLKPKDNVHYALRNPYFEKILCTTASLENTRLKTKWLREYEIPIDNHIFLSHGVPKSVLKMEKDSVFVDDHHDNINTVSAGFRIPFGRRTNWNKDCSDYYTWCHDMIELDKELYKIAAYEKNT